MIIRYRICGCLILIFLFIFLNKSYSQNNYGKIRSICIDAGHGGADPGSVGSKSYEKNVTLSLALQVGKEIQEKFPDIKVVYTRDKDVSVALKDRGKIAGKHKTDLFMSIHTNSVTNKGVTGIETYVLGTHKSEENLRVAMKENAVIKYEDDYSVKYAGFDPSRPESYIIFSLVQNLHQEKSLELAALVQSELVKSTRKVDRGVRQAPFWVLKEAAMPAILIETGFISNNEEERFLNSSEGQKKIVASIVNAFRVFKENFEKNSSMISERVLEEEKRAEIVDATESPDGEDFFYAVQIGSAAARMNAPDKLYEGENVKEIQAGGRYRYYIGACGSYDDVRQNLENAKKQVKDCFIIAISNGELITVGEARRIEKKQK